MAQEHVDEVYDYSACSIDTHKIGQLLRNCKEFYSERLVSIVERLISHRPDDRHTLRTVLNKLSYKTDNDKKIDMQLVQDKNKAQDYEEYIDHLAPIKEEIQYPNYLRGLVFPKIGRAGEYYDDKNIDEDGFGHRASSINQGIDEETVTAKQRFYYANRNSSYIG